MRIRSLLLIFLLVLIGAFVALNWSVFLTNSTVSLGVATVQAPLGLLTLGLLLFVVAYFMVYVLYLQSTVMWDARRNAKELQANRELADKAEASRFTELRGVLEAGQQAVLARLDALEKNLRAPQ
nr:LapA family protein [uncultured Rhodoferax sp.]